MSEQNPFFDFTPELDGDESSAAVQATNTWFSFSLDGSSEEIDPSVPPWESIDFDLLNELGPRGCDRPLAQSATSTDSDSGVTPRGKMRRRAQNRASQRAFRERKERHVKGLEGQLKTMDEKHQQLIRSYTTQADHVTKLHHRVAQLQAEIKAFKSCNQQSLPSQGASANPRPLLPERFDAFSFTPDSDPMLYDSNELNFDRPQSIPSSHKLATTITLPLFEDLLLHCP